MVATSVFPLALRCGNSLYVCILQSRQQVGIRVLRVDSNARQETLPSYSFLSWKFLE